MRLHKLNTFLRLSQEDCKTLLDITSNKNDPHKQGTKSSLLRLLDKELEVGNITKKQHIEYITHLNERLQGKSPVRTWISNLALKTHQNIKISNAKTKKQNTNIDYEYLDIAFVTFLILKVLNKNFDEYYTSLKRYKEELEKFNNGNEFKTTYEKATYNLDNFYIDHNLYACHFDQALSSTIHDLLIKVPDKGRRLSIKILNSFFDISDKKDCELLVKVTNISPIILLYNSIKYEKIKSTLETQDHEYLLFLDFCYNTETRVSTRFNTLIAKFESKVYFTGQLLELFIVDDDQFIIFKDEVPDEYSNFKSYIESIIKVELNKMNKVITKKFLKYFVFLGNTNNKSPKVIQSIVFDAILKTLEYIVWSKYDELSDKYGKKHLSFSKEDFRTQLTTSLIGYESVVERPKNILISYLNKRSIEYFDQLINDLSDKDVKSIQVLNTSYIRSLEEAAILSNKYKTYRLTKK